MDIKKVTSCILPGFVLGFYDEEHIMLLKSCVKRNDCTMRIKVLGHEDCSYFDMDVNDNCAAPDCILNICSYDHFHSKLSCHGVYINVVLIKYTSDHDIFDDLKGDIRMDNNIMDLNNYDVDELPFCYYSVEHMVWDNSLETDWDDNNWGLL